MSLFSPARSIARRFLQTASCKPFPLWVVAIGLAALFSAQSPAAAPKAPRNVDEARAVPNKEAANGVAVKLSAVLTAYDAGSSRLYLQDESGAIPVVTNADVEAATTALLPSLRPGDRLEVSGWITPGAVSNVVAGKKGKPLVIHMLGHGSLPDPLELGRSLKPTTQMHAFRAEVTGYVCGIQRQGETRVLRVLRAGSVIDVSLLFEDAEDVTEGDLLGSDIRVSGVLAISFGKDGQAYPKLYVSVPDDLQITDESLKKAFSRWNSDVAAARRYAADDGVRLRFNGRVIGCVGGRIMYVRIGKEGLRLHSPLLPDIDPGTDADIAGFPMIRDGELFIEDAVVHVQEANEPVTPVAIQFGEHPNLKDDANLVRMSARLTNQLGRGSDTVMLLESGSIAFYARSLHDRGATTWPRFEPGSLLELTGICDMSPVNIGVGRFNLLLREAGDIRLVQSPPFWTPRRMAVPAVVLFIVVIGTTAWLVSLRKTVREQTELITQKIERERVAEERSRIARELHDSLEQHLAGMAIQIDLASSRMRSSADRAGESLEVARALVRRGHEETRHAIWQLRSAAVAGGDLPGALEEALQWYSPDLPVTIQTHGTKRPLPPTATHHLLRIAQEAAGNALKHAEPTAIRIHIEFGSTALAMAVRDNGKGFDPDGNGSAKPGHFGLEGMRERAQKLGGELTIESAPGAGTTITVCIPWDRLEAT